MFTAFCKFAFVLFLSIIFCGIIGIIFPYSMTAQWIAKGVVAPFVIYYYVKIIITMFKGKGKETMNKSSIIIVSLTCLIVLTGCGPTREDSVRSYKIERDTFYRNGNAPTMSIRDMDKVGIWYPDDYSEDKKTDAKYFGQPFNLEEGLKEQPQLPPYEPTDKDIERYRRLREN